MADAIQPWRIVVDPIGPLGNVYFFLEQALDAARALEVNGHTIKAIVKGTEVIEGAALRDALGDVTVPEFVAFPTSL